ncbi:MAG: hypothetical protein ABIC40_05175, partial [bacterium]
MRTRKILIVVIIVIILLIGIHYSRPFFAKIGAVKGWSRNKPDVPEFKWALNLPVNQNPAVNPSPARLNYYNIIWSDVFSMAADRDGNPIVGTDKLCKYSPDGELIWELNPDKKLMNGTVVGFSRIAVDENGQIYAVGYKESVSGVTMEYGYSLAPGNFDAFLIIADPLGNIVKTILWDEASMGLSWPCAIVLDENKNIYLAGNFIGKLDFDLGKSEAIEESYRETSYNGSKGEWE